MDECKEINGGVASNLQHPESVSQSKAVEGISSGTLQTPGEQCFEVEACEFKDNDTLPKMVNFRETSLDKDNTVNHKLNAESENSAGIHLDVENTEPDIFREPSSEKDMAWVGSQAEVEVKKPNVESLRDPSFMRNKAGEVIYEDNSLGNSVTEYGRNVIDDHDPVAENMSIETDNAESENSECSDSFGCGKYRTRHSQGTQL